MARGRPGVAATIGVFDGVHRGHQSLVRAMVTSARAEDLGTVCITFDPDPQAVLQPDQPILALSSVAERLALLRSVGVDRVEVVPFTLEVSTQTPEQFIASLRLRFPLEALWVGSGFALGHERSGTVEALERIGRGAGFRVYEVAPVIHAGRPVSSTWIRTALKEGDVALAAELLGRPYCLAGEVVSGARRGQELGFPTANLVPPAGRALPADGVYFVQVGFDESGTGQDSSHGRWDGRSSIGQVPWYGVVNLGGRPTFSESERLLETHLLDFEGDLYGERLRICFLEQLRGIRRFSSVDELRDQIRRDVVSARELRRARERD